VERVFIQVEPYGDEFVTIKSGLAEGDELRAQEQPPFSGQSGMGGQRQNAQPAPSMRRMPGGVRFPGGG
jgi:hypothetical protein